MSTQKNTLTQSRLKELLHYDPDTGAFRWLITRSRLARSGDVAGNLWVDPKNGAILRQIGVDGRTYFAHRLAWLYVHGSFPKGQIDHINRDSTDNRIANLRDVSNSENQHNTPPPVTNTSGVKGIRWNKEKRRWHSRIVKQGKSYHLGWFKTFDAAARARFDAELLLTDVHPPATRVWFILYDSPKID